MTPKLTWPEIMKKLDQDKLQICLNSKSYATLANVSQNLYI